MEGIYLGSRSRAGISGEVNDEITVLRDGTASGIVMRWEEKRERECSLFHIDSSGFAVESRRGRLPDHSQHRHLSCIQNTESRINGLFSVTGTDIYYSCDEVKGRNKPEEMVVLQSDSIRVPLEVGAVLSRRLGLDRRAYYLIKLCIN